MRKPPATATPNPPTVTAPVADSTLFRNRPLIDLSQWGELWEDMYDVMVSQGSPQRSTGALGGVESRDGIG